MRQFRSVASSVAASPDCDSRLPSYCSANHLQLVVKLEHELWRQILRLLVDSNQFNEAAELLMKSINADDVKVSANLLVDFLHLLLNALDSSVINAERFLEILETIRQSRPELFSRLLIYLGQLNLLLDPLTMRSRLVSQVRGAP